MKIKTNLHFHTKEDPVDWVRYSLQEGIDHAARLGFGALAVTCHQKAVVTNEHVEYAKSKGIVLIPGIEKDIRENPAEGRRSHVVFLNCTQDVEKVETFADAFEYKKTNPDVFVLAPHPFFFGNFSLQENLEKYIDLFDAVEYSWFYTKKINRNIPATEIAQKHALPIIATSDTHFLDFLDKSYCVVDAEENTRSSILQALRDGHVENITSPRSLVFELLLRQGMFSFQDQYKKFLNMFYGGKALVPQEQSSGR